MTTVTLVYGGSAAAREQAIAAQADPHRPGVAIVEGLASGQSPLDAIAPATLRTIRVAPGCPCCTGNLTMRVTLNRLLRQAPARLYLSLADASHREQVRAFLQDPQYQAHLELGPELECPGNGHGICEQRY